MGISATPGSIRDTCNERSRPLRPLQGNEIDKTYIPTYFFLGGAGTGKSRHASEFASSVEKAITLREEDPLYRTQRPFYHELEQRLKKAFVFHVSFENGTSLDEEENNLWHAVGARMLHQLLGEPIEYITKRFVADPRTVFRLVAAAHKVDLYDDFTGIWLSTEFKRLLMRPMTG